MHTPVLLKEAIQALELKKDGTYIDLTAGEGGHLEEIAAGGEKVLAIDADPSQIGNLKEKFKNKKNITYAVGNFTDIRRIAAKHNFEEVEGILIDLGLSMKQLTISKKGFSFKNKEEALDMRFIENATLAASDILNSFSKLELEEVFAKYGEEPMAEKIALQIVKTRRFKRIVTVGDLSFCIDAAAGGPREDVYRRVFQALRIAVNNELENLKKVLAESLEVLKPEGRLVVISFHSLEDRIVKDFVKEKRLMTLTKKPVTNRRGPSFEKNAKMRVIINKKIN